MVKSIISKKCPKCGRFMEIDPAYFEAKDNHFFCNHCDMFYCFEKGCHCCDKETELGGK